jgi:hypothetical protein
MCKYCDGGKTIGTVLGTVVIEDGQICLASASLWRTVVGNIKYCPMCGKKLSSKTLEELEKENKILEKKAIKYKEENEKDEYEEDEEW